MGIEIWALMALAAVLTVYLLPFLVGRREVMSLSNAEDRYSARLRVLATGGALAADEACESSGHVMIFRRRPEVKAMNRPAVRNVRALRAERELLRARRAHEQARARRRVAASHRGAVAMTLLGVTLGMVVLVLITTVPWWSALLPTALLGGSMVAGRRAAVASAEADRRERRRIAELERELSALTGIEPRELREPWQREPSAEARPWSQAVGPQGSRPLHEERTGAQAVDDVAQARPDGAAVGSGRTASAQSAPSAESAESARSAQSPEVAAPAAGGRGGRADESSRAAGREVGSEAASETGPVEGAPSTRSAEELDELGEVERAVRALAAAAQRTQGRRGAGSGSTRPEGTGAARSEATVASPSTPPQGWRPVHVPAPTYTLSARAPRRVIEPAEDAPFDSAPVPARPTAVRSFSTEGVGQEETVFHPIDLDAVLERRRAAGA
ncbi:hypothetical protein [Actinomyces howellii]|uniref:Uncharacterized protein n=1 Tax=Actinomyces howellii TaxID=52771 RepID=A0A3S4RXT2_9ACTO|nr:hypothetical protein [Actinomyces howellii]VEG29575.1 Uncharacterised protein [Actinomyces howellii]